jgi:hypothetical protein
MIKNQFAERFQKLIAPSVPVPVPLSFPFVVFEQTKSALVSYPVLHFAHLKSFKGALKTSQFTSGFGV